ncbi:hypothetical protein Tco_0174448 [Tanacetum coccineum]
MPTEMELTLEQTQQGVSYEVSVDPQGFKDGGEVKEFQRSFRHSDTERLSRSDEVLKLKNFKKDATLKLSKSTNQEWYEHVGPEVTRSQDDKACNRYKDLLRACPHHGFTELYQLDTFYNALNPTDQDSLNSAVDGNLLERSTRDVLTIIENKSKVRNSQNKSIVSQVKSSDVNSYSSSEIAKLTHAVNQQTSAVTTAMTAILKQFQATPPPASVKAIEEICVTCGGAHPYYQCLAADGNTF